LIYLESITLGQVSSGSKPPASDPLKEVSPIRISLLSPAAQSFILQAPWRGNDPREKPLTKKGDCRLPRFSLGYYLGAGKVYRILADQKSQRAERANAVPGPRCTGLPSIGNARLFNLGTGLTMGRHVRSFSVAQSPHMGCSASGQFQTQRFSRYMNCAGFSPIFPMAEKLQHQL
jgi:hypothetical protein